MSSQVVHAAEAEVVFAKTGFNRYGILAILGTLSLMMALVSILGPILQPNSVITPQMNWTSLVFGIGGLLIGAWYAGPCDLRLNPHTRQYTFTAGWPFIARTIHGSFDDIRGFLIQPGLHRGFEASWDQLEVLWADPKRKSPPLLYLHTTKAYKVKDDIERKLHIPLEWKTSRK